MHCDEYVKLELARRIVAHDVSATHPQRSGAEKAHVQTMFDYSSVAAELKRLDVEIESHLASCEVCKSSK
jgi:hypothetical protein